MMGELTLGSIGVMGELTLGSIGVMIVLTLGSIGDGCCLKGVILRCDDSTNS